MNWYQLYSIARIGLSINSNGLKRLEFCLGFWMIMSQSRSSEPRALHRLSLKVARITAKYSELSNKYHKVGCRGYFVYMVIPKCELNPNWDWIWWQSHRHPQQICSEDQTHGATRSIEWHQKSMYTVYPFVYIFHRLDIRYILFCATPTLGHSLFLSFRRRAATQKTLWPSTDVSGLAPLSLVTVSPMDDVIQPGDGVLNFS